MTRMRARIYIIGVLTALLCAACHNQPAAYEYRPTPLDGWEPGDTLRFRVDSLAASGNYCLNLGVRTSAMHSYPYRTLWLRIEQRWHNPETTRTDTVELSFVDSEGNFLGQGVSLYTFTQSVGRLQLRSGQSADITVNHLMRSEMLEGVEAVGICLEAGMPG